MATVWPLLALALLEAVLRAAGFGHPTSFFVRKQLGGRAVLVENDWFGLRFFPPALARSPYPVVMEADKPAGLYRIFLFGESAALGEPRPAFGAGRYLETLLRERFPGVKFEVVCVAMTAINSHAILPIARECAGYNGDLWIVYMGNNEFLGPFGGSTVFGLQALPNAWVRAYLALQRTRIGQGLVTLARRMGGGQSTPASWGGMKMFLDHQLPPNDPRKERIYANFRQNLADIIQAGRRARVPIILSSLACNLKDCAPFGSLHAPALDRSTLVQWEGLRAAGVTNAERGEIAGSIRRFEAAAKLSPNYAETHFRLGQCYLAVTNTEAARRSFSRARDLDSLPFRADSEINRLIAETARRFSAQGVAYLDAERALAPSGPGQIPGEEFFYEHVHLNFQGNYRLARALADQVLTSLPSSVAGRQTDAWAGPEVCARDLGLTDWNRCAVFEEIARRLAEPPFTQQLNHDRQLQKLAADLAECRLRLQDPRALDNARRTYQEALQKDPRDHWLHHNYAEFLANTGDLGAATEQMRAVQALAPQHQAACLQLGRLLASQGNLEEALREYAKAGTFHQDDARVRFLEAEVLEKQKKRSQAIHSLRDAIALRPSYWEAHERLGMELGLSGESSGAVAEFEHVVRLRPDYVEGHLNLGIALARQQRFSEALDQFQTALRLDPRNAKAAQYIAKLEALTARPAPP